MQRYFRNKKLKFGFHLIALLPVVMLFSSCMVMAPGHLTRATTQIEIGNDEPDVYIDPVCGKEIVNTSTGFAYRYNDQIYYFHTENCKNRFVKVPDKYIHHHDYIKSNHSGGWLEMGGIAMGAMMLVMLF